MRSRFEVFLNGIPLSTICPSAYIRDIQVSSPKVNTTRHNKALYNGGLLVNKQINSTSIKICFEIMSYDIDIYRRDVAKIQKWACSDGYMTLNDRLEKQLYVTCTSYPTVNSQLQWTEELTMTFESVSYPFWQDREKTSKTIVVTQSDVGTGNGELYKADELLVTRSCFDPMVEVLCTVNDGPLNWINFISDNTRLSFSGINIPTNGTIHIYYDYLHILHMESTGGTSLFPNRAVDSDDDLALRVGGQNTIAVSANCPVTAVFEMQEVSL